MKQRPTWWSRAAILVTAASAAAAAAAGVRAATADPRLALYVPASEATAVRAAIGSTVGAQSEELGRIVSRAVDRNPFRPDRSRPDSRFGEEEASFEHIEEAFNEFYTPEPQVRLLGLAAAGLHGGLAAVEIAGLGQRILRVGEELGGYRLLSVSATEARLSGRDSVLVLRLSSPTSLP